MCVLDLSKYLMHDFKYKGRVGFMFTDTLTPLLMIYIRKMYINKYLMIRTSLIIAIIILNQSSVIQPIKKSL